MSDSKISALAALTSLSAADELAVASSGVSKKIRGDHLPGFQLDYVEITVSVSVTATADGNGNGTAVIDGNSVTYDGSTRICIEFDGIGNITPVTDGHLLACNLYDGTNDLGRLCELAGTVATKNTRAPLHRRRFLTPTAGAHTYHIRAWKDAAGDTASILAGAGGASTIVPAFMRITVA